MALCYNSRTVLPPRVRLGTWTILVLLPLMPLPGCCWIGALPLPGLYGEEPQEAGWGPLSGTSWGDLSAQALSDAYQAADPSSQGGGNCFQFLTILPLHCKILCFLGGWGWGWFTCACV